MNNAAAKKVSEAVVTVDGADYRIIRKAFGWDEEVGLGSRRVDMETGEAVKAAAEYLKARKLACGDWIYRDDAMGRYYVVDEHDLAKLPAYMGREGPAWGYSLWCGETDAAEATAEQVAEIDRSDDEAAARGGR